MRKHDGIIVICPKDSRKKRGGKGQEEDKATGFARTASGQQEDKRRTQDSRSTSGQEEETGFASAASRTTGGEEKDNRRTTPGHRVQGRAHRLASVFFPKREPQQ